MSLYVQNDDKMVYSVEMKVRQASEFFYLLELTLIGGWDYITEESDRQGYVSNERFVEDVQYESFTFYPMFETIIDRLKEEGFEKVELKDLQAEHLLASF